ncbi:peptidoglycan-binding protein [Variovorax boronicumulans]|uniref:peptidoglycan-binding protein n=1 Tax=Variovorax boronicumulans TaxID=436515 RepID=UPI003397CB82
MTLLRQGSRGTDVRRLQEALNRKLQPSPALATDGDYGPRTRTAVLRLQAANWLVEDGEAGPCTQNVAFDSEGSAPILHPVALIPQPTPTQCWAASTAMVTRTTVTSVVSRTPADLIASDGGLLNFSDTGDAMTGSQRYAAAHSLSLRPPMSWSVGMLRDALRGAPLMFDMLWNAREYATGAGSPGHFIVVAGIRGDNDASGRGTTLRIFDPWPPGRGERCSVGYFQWIQDVPTRTYRVFQR